MECPLLESGVNLAGRHVVESIERVQAVLPWPESINIDNGSEFAGGVGWLSLSALREARLHPSGKPVESGSNESFNGKLREQWRNSEVFLNIDDACVKLGNSRHGYEYIRPHSREQIGLLLLCP
jgi:putative transposase